MSGASSFETEIKLPVADTSAARRLLRRAGFRVSKRRVFESNALFDTPDLGLRLAGSVVRVREAGRGATLTFKGPATVTDYKTREELETAVGSAQTMEAVLERLGFAAVFRYQKYRTEFRQAGVAGLATLDETPIGVFMELEGEPEWIDLAAAAMGFSTADYLTASYARLYLDWCRKRGLAPRDMVFEGN